MPNDRNGTTTATPYLEQLRDELKRRGWKNVDLTHGSSALKVANPDDQELAGVVICDGRTFGWESGGTIAPVHELDTAVQRITWVLAHPVGAGMRDER